MSDTTQWDKEVNLIVIATVGILLGLALIGAGLVGLGIIILALGLAYHVHLFYTYRWASLKEYIEQEVIPAIEKQWRK